MNPSPMPNTTKGSRPISVIKSPRPTKFRPLMQWSMRGAASLLDQGLFSGGQFALNILLARWFTVTDYGRFSVIYSLILFVNSVHMAFVSEPTLVFWAKHRQREHHFLADTVLFNSIFSAILLTGTVVLGTILRGLNLVTAEDIFLAALLAMTQPLFWHFRQIAYAQLRPWWAVAQTGLYAVLLLGGTVTLKLTGWLSLSSVLATMAGAALVPAVLAAARNRPAFELPIAHDTRHALRDCFRYGIWSAPSGVAMWIMTNITIIAMPLAASLEAAGRLKACLNILMPFQQILIGLSLLALPALARTTTAGDKHRTRTIIWWFFIVAMGGGATLCAILAIWGGPFFRLLYGARYAGDVRLFRYGLLLPLIWPAITVARTVLRAFENPKAIFLAYAASLGAVGLIAVPVGTLHGPEGALIAMTVMHAVLAGFLMRSVIKGAQRLHV
jgi:O-antigen/teichoic acid export membrane protein